MVKMRLCPGVALLLLLLYLQPVSGDYKLVCYFTNWSQHRSGPAKITTAQVDPHLCTHLIYAFVGIEKNKITSTELNEDAVYKQFNGLKNQNANLTTMVVVGGSSFGSRFSTMLATSETRKTFIDSVIPFLKKYNFNGIDLDFEFPGTNGSPPEDTKHFSLLIQEMRRAFQRESESSGQPRLLMSAAVSANKDTIDGSYDAPTLGRYLDFINVKTYDYHGGWDSVTGHNSPLNRGSAEQGNSIYFNSEFAMNYWKDKGVPREKLIMGFSAYGRTFKLSPSASCNIGVPVSGVGPAGKFTGEPGMLTYYEVCGLLKGATIKFSDDQKVPYACKGDQWIGYDNTRSIGYKVDFLKSSGFGGAMVWALDLDDFSGTFCKEGKYPLIGKLKQTLAVN